MTRASSSSIPKHPPPSFVCPLTFEIMEEPVMDKCAHSFERQAIIEWIAKGNDFCPISRKQLSVDDLLPNHVLAERIDKWQFQQSSQKMEPIREGDQQKHTTSLPEDDTTMSERQRHHHHDSILLTRTPSSSDDDIELGRRQRRQQNPGLRQQQTKYQQVPMNQFMLLPQEREVLQIVRARAEENRLRKRRHLIQTTLLVSVLVILAIVLGLGVARYVSSSNSQEEEGPDEMTRRDGDGIGIDDINNDDSIDML